MAEAIAGTAYVRVDGRQYNLEGSLKVMPSSIKREAKVGLSGVVGYKEEFMAPAIEGTFFADRGVSFSDLEGIKDATVQAELVSGKRFILRNAFYMGAAELEAAEGTFTARFEGLSMEEF